MKRTLWRKRYIKTVWLGLVFAGLQGCSSTPMPPNSTVSDYRLTSLNLPYDAATFPTQDNEQSKEALKDIQLSLKERNLYLTVARNIHFIKGECPIEVSAHRGNPSAPENSINGIVGAAYGGFDGAEIDVMLTRDGAWVTHHDLYTGRATGRADGERFRISRMSKKEWEGIAHRNKDGVLTQIRAPYAWEMFREWGEVGVYAQKLNIEIKTEADIDDLSNLDKLARTYIQPGRYFYSSMDMDVLEKMRELNPDVYLGYIWDPDPVSLDKFKRDVRRAARSDDYYQKNRKYIEQAFSYETRYRNRQKSKKLSAKAVRSKLGGNSGLHVDIRSYARYATIYDRSKQLGLKVATYSINGTDYHQKQLVKLQKQGRRLPDEAIMDTTKQVICSKLKPSLITNPKGSYHPTTEFGALIQKLPKDADFNELENQYEYMADGHYMNVNGQVRKYVGLNANSQKRPARKAKPKREGPVFHVQDEEFDITEKPILISLPTSK